MIELASDIPTLKKVGETLDDIESDLFSISARVNGSQDLADFKGNVESMKKRIAELREYLKG